MQCYLYANVGDFAEEKKNFQFLLETLLNGMGLTNVRWDCSCTFSFEVSC